MNIIGKAWTENTRNIYNTNGKARSTWNEMTECLCFIWGWKVEDDHLFTTGCLYLFTIYPGSVIFTKRNKNTKRNVQP